MNTNEKLRTEIESRRIAFHCTMVALRDKARAYHLTGSDLHDDATRSPAPGANRTPQGPQFTIRPPRVSPTRRRDPITGLFAGIGKGSRNALAYFM